MINRIKLSYQIKLTSSAILKDERLLESLSQYLGKEREVERIM